MNAHEETDLRRSEIENQLIIASRKGKLEEVELLIRTGTNLYLGNDLPLQLAHHNGHRKIVDLLLIKGNFNCQNPDEITFRNKLYCKAVLEKRYSFVKRLLNENITRSVEVVILDAALKIDDTKMMKLIMNEINCSSVLYHVGDRIQRLKD